MYHDRHIAPHIARWSDDDDAKLRDLATKGLSAGEIVGRFAGQRTRNSIIGRCHRLGIALGVGRADELRRLRQSANEQAAALAARAAREERARAEKLARRRAAEARAAAAAQKAETPPVAVPEPATPLVHVHAREGKPLLALKLGECRWGITPHFARSHRFCAEPVMAEGRPYCRDHWTLSLSSEIRDKALSAEARAAHCKRTSGQKFA